MDQSGTHRFFERFLKDWAALLRIAGLFLAAAAALGLLSFAVVYPAWALAIGDPFVFNVIIVSAVAAFALASIALAVRRSWKKLGASGFFAALGKTLVPVCLALALLAGIVGAIWFFARSVFLLAIPCVAVAIVATGFLFSRRRHRAS